MECRIHSNDSQREILLRATTKIFFHTKFYSKKLYIKILIKSKYNRFILFIGVFNGNEKHTNKRRF